MKPASLCIAFLYLLCPYPSNAQTSNHSIVVDACTMTSEILGGERKYAVYLPPGYALSTRSYPILYLLHGGGDDQTGWVQFGEVQHIADKAIADGTATPMVIVKDLNSVRWYIDCGDDDFLYEGNALIHIAMRKREITHEFRVRDGGHKWSYWRASLPKVLSFVSEAFHQN